MTAPTEEDRSPQLPEKSDRRLGKRRGPELRELRAENTLRDELDRDVKERRDDQRQVDRPRHGRLGFFTSPLGTRATSIPMNANISSKTVLPSASPFGQPGQAIAGRLNEKNADRR